MTVSEVIKKMVAYSEGNLHDINHFMKVYAYAKTIAEGENLNPELQKLVEVTAVVHDIACPLCRVKYGNTNGKHQEERKCGTVRRILQGFRPAKRIYRQSFLYCKSSPYDRRNRWH